MSNIALTVEGKATIIGNRIKVANTFATRFLGLMGKKKLAPGSGLLIVPSSGVHTCWMRMPIDVVALDKENRVVALGHAVRPWRISGLRTATKSVLELPAGRAEACGLEVGDKLVLRSESIVGGDSHAQF